MHFKQISNVVVVAALVCALFNEARAGVITTTNGKNSNSNGSSSSGSSSSRSSNGNANGNGNGNGNGSANGNSGTSGSSGSSSGGSSNSNGSSNGNANGNSNGSSNGTTDSGNGNSGSSSGGSSSSNGNANGNGNGNGDGPANGNSGTSGSSGSSSGGSSNSNGSANGSNNGSSDSTDTNVNGGLSNGGSSSSNPAIFFTTPGATVSDGPVRAMAIFHFGNGTLDIRLQNLLADPTSDGQNISALLFTLGGGLSNPVLTVPIGTLRTVADDKSFNDALGQPLDRWQIVDSSLPTLELSVLTGGKPNSLIIGPPNGSTGKYDSSNASIDQHKPEAALFIDFHLNISGIAPGVSVGNVIFQFGTQEGTARVAGIPDDRNGIENVGVPEPQSLLVWTCLGLCILAGRRFRKGRMDFAHEQAV